MSSLCDNVELFVDGELPPWESEGYRQHLAGCRRCQRAMTERVQLKYLAGLHKSEDVFTRTIERLAQELRERDSLQGSTEEEARRPRPARYSRPLKAKGE